MYNSTHLSFAASGSHFTLVQEERERGNFYDQIRKRKINLLLNTQTGSIFTAVTGRKALQSQTGNPTKWFSSPACVCRLNHVKTRQQKLDISVSAHRTVLTTIMCTSSYKQALKGLPDNKLLFSTSRSTVLQISIDFRHILLCMQFLCQIDTTLIVDVRYINS